MLSLGEGIFTMGLVKTIYNVLGGFYMDYNITNATESVHKLNKKSPTFHQNRKNPLRTWTVAQ